jgi:hypothetical protein
VNLIFISPLKLNILWIPLKIIFLLEIDIVIRSSRN